MSDLLDDVLLCRPCFHGNHHACDDFARCECAACPTARDNPCASPIFSMRLHGLADDIDWNYDRITVRLVDEPWSPEVLLSPPEFVDLVQPLRTASVEVTLDQVNPELLALLLGVPHDAANSLTICDRCEKILFTDDHLCEETT